MSHDAKPDLSLLVPLYNEEANVAPLLEAIKDAMASLPRSYEVVLVDDGSSDQTPRLLREAASKDARLRVILLRRNFGQTAALAAAIAHAEADVLCPLDADLQNDPNDIPKLLAKLDEGYDVASGWRRRRKDPFFTRILPSRIANGLISFISGVHLHDYGCSLKAYRREVLENVNLVGEMHRFVPILASWQGARVAEVEVNHRPRVAGKSKYGIGRTFKVVLDLITIKFMGSFLTKPIYVFGGAGAGLGFLSALLACYTLWQKLAYGVWVHRNPLFLVAIFFGLVGVQLIMMGLLGELLTRVYFAATKTAPYVVREVIECQDEDISQYKGTKDTKGKM